MKKISIVVVLLALILYIINRVRSNDLVETDVNSDIEGAA